MLKRYRHIMFAVVGWLSLANAAHPQPTAQATQSQRAADLNANTARIVDAIDRMAARQDVGCPDRANRRGSELCAQWKAADAARDAADFTLFAVFLSFIGTALIAATFWEQRRVSRAELRAYVGVDPKEVHIFENGQVDVHLLVVNSGQTPAFNARWAGNVLITTEEKLERDLALTDFDAAPVGRKIDATVHAHREATAVLRNHENFTRERLSDAAAGKTVNLFVCGTVWYDDAFGRSRRTNFCFMAKSLPKPGESTEGKPIPGWWATPFINNTT